MPSGDLRKLSDLFSLSHWSEQYAEHRWRGHVFCPADCQKQVHDAAVQVIKSKYGLEFNEFAAQLSHIPDK